MDNQKIVTDTGAVIQQLRDYESRNVTFVEPDGSWPVVWERAKDVHVWDVEGKKYLDLTAAFGVAAAGHARIHRLSKPARPSSPGCRMRWGMCIRTLARLRLAAWSISRNHF